MGTKSVELNRTIRWANSWSKVCYVSEWDVDRIGHKLLEGHKYKRKRRAMVKVVTQEIRTKE